MSKPYSQEHPLRVLIIKPSSMGDIIHAFPAVELLLSHHPDAEIDWLVHPAFAGLLDYCRNIRNVIHFPRRELGRARTFLPCFIRLSRALRRRRYDLVVDLQGLMRSAIFGRLTRHRRFAGFAAPREAAAGMLYRERIAIPGDCRHAVEKNLALMSGLLRVPLPDAPPPPLPVNAPAAAAAAALLQSRGIAPGDRLLGIIPGARWETKRWPEAFFATVIADLAQRDPGLKFVLLGAPAEKASADLILAAGNLSGRLVSLAGATGIGELVEIIRATCGLLTNDSGPMHIAAALQVPVFALFGPTVPEKTGPWGAIHHIFRPDLDCCGCLKRVCPRGDSRCREMIDPLATAQTVFETIHGD